jgi:disulfide bond formation protein DsbB
MKISGSRKLFFIFLLYFFAFVTFINFFHTDSILDNQQDCPACQFQRSNIALAAILFLFLIIFICLRLPVAPDFVPVRFHLPATKRSRAPPAHFS